MAEGGIEDENYKSNNNSAVVFRCIGVRTILRN
nr:MAG TPA: hypothetical protein [Caudoviricetes sp.]